LNIPKWGAYCNLKFCLGGNTPDVGRLDVDAHAAGPVNNAAVETAPCWMNDLLFILDGLEIIQALNEYTMIE
jgi:hypothetical protein